MKISSSLLAAILISACSQASGSEFFSFDRQSFLNRLRGELARMGASIDIPTLVCGKGNVLRSCSSTVTPGIRLTVSDTFKARDADSQANRLQAIERFQAGDLGAVHSARFDADAAVARALGEPAISDLCTAMIRVFRPGLSEKRARERFATAHSRALRGVSDGLGEGRVRGKPETLVVTALKDGSLSCAVTAEES